MHFRNFFTIIVSFILIGSCTLLFISEECKADSVEIYVDVNYRGFSDGSAEHPFRSINKALSEAEDGDTIYVFGGFYDEALIIDKELKLWGSIENGPSIIDYSEDLRYTVEISADYVEFQDFEIYDNEKVKESPLGALVYIKSNNVVIQDNIISNSNSWGVYLAPDSDGNVISGNEINSFVNGIYISSSDTNDVFNNVIENCSDKAIYVESSQENRFYGNSINSSLYGIYAQYCNNINISNNTFNDINYHGVYINQINSGVIQNNLINNVFMDALYVKSNNIIVRNNTLDINRRGIALFGSDCNIFNNIISNSSSSGINAESQSYNNIIYHNYFYDNNPSAQENGDNYWFYINQGNYWDDYDYIDKDLDGVGDRYYTNNGVMDVYPLGYFLKPPKKPSDPEPEDTESGTTLQVTLEVYVEDPDSDLLTVSFYRADTDTLIDGHGRNPIRNVESGSRVSYRFTQPFNATVTWYVIVNDSLLENRSDIWFFITRASPPDNEPPVANAGGPYTAEVDESLQLDASKCNDPDGTVVFYRWNFGDGSSQILEENPTHIYRNSGIYTVTLTIIDNDNAVDVDITTVEISPTTNQKPTANIVIPSDGYSNSEIYFSSSGTSDPDGDVLTYHWSFGDDTTSTEQNPIHVYQSEGTYLVTLEVSDSQYSNTASSLIKIENPPSEFPGFELILILTAFLIVLSINIKRSKKF
jgi:parallel beta-helix repeat protein